MYVEVRGHTVANRLKVIQESHRVRREGECCLNGTRVVRANGLANGAPRGNVTALVEAARVAPHGPAYGETAYGRHNWHLQCGCKCAWAMGVANKKIKKKSKESNGKKNSNSSTVLYLLRQR